MKKHKKNINFYYLRFLDGVRQEFSGCHISMYWTDHLLNYNMMNSNVQKKNP